MCDIRYMENNLITQKLDIKHLNEDPLVDQEQIDQLIDILKGFKKVNRFDGKIYQAIRDLDAHSKIKSMLIRVRVLQDYKTDCLSPISTMLH